MPGALWATRRHKARCLVGSSPHGQTGDSSRGTPRIPEGVPAAVRLRRRSAAARLGAVSTFETFHLPAPAFDLSHESFELWDTPVPSGKWRYYGGMLYTLELLHVSGNFRIYSPA